MNKVATAVLAAGVLTLGACSSDGDSGSSTPPPSSAPASSSSSSSAAPSSSSAPSSTTAGGLSSALLAASDIGSGFSGGPTQSSDGSALPCTPNDPPLKQQVPPSDQGDASFKNADDSVEINETVAEFGDESTADKAFQIATKGFSCATGTAGGRKVKIVARGSTGSELKAWDFTDGAQFKGTAVIAKVGKRFVGLTFVAKPNAGNDVEVGGISQKAVQKASQ